MKQKILPNSVDVRKKKVIFVENKQKCDKEALLGLMLIVFTISPVAHVIFFHVMYLYKTSVAPPFTHKRLLKRTGLQQAQKYDDREN